MKPAATTQNRERYRHSINRHLSPVRPVQYGPYRARDIYYAYRFIVVGWLDSEFDGCVIEPGP